MAALDNTIEITPDELKTSFAKYRKDIIKMPVRALDEAAKFMSRRVGVRGKETVGELAGDMELGPYSLTRKDENGVTITGRTLETFLGSCVKPFEPNAVRESIWGSNVFQGEALKNQPITKLIGMFLAGKIGEALFKNLFTMKRNPAGSGTADLADGFKTISDAEIKAKAISVAKGNLFNTTAMTGVNAVDAIEAFYDHADAKLQGINTYMFMNSRTTINVTQSKLRVNTSSFKTLALSFWCVVSILLLPHLIIIIFLFLPNTIISIISILNRLSILVSRITLSFSTCRHNQ